jgi:hypothetical protein
MVQTQPDVVVGLVVGLFAGSVIRVPVSES